MANLYTTSLVSSAEIAKDMLELRFIKPNNFSFRAGQFVQFHIPNGEKMVLRSYSLSSTPTDMYMEFCSKILPNGKASILFKNLVPGDEVTFQGPQGRFICDSIDSPLYFIATGAGLAPIMGIIRDELENKKNKGEIRLLFGVRAEEDVFWQDRLDMFKQQNENFAYSLTLSQPREKWSGLKGRVTDHVLHHLVNHQFFLCGSPEMVKDMRKILLQNSVEAGKILFEVF